MTTIVTDHALDLACKEIAAEVFADLFTDNEEAKGMTPDDFADEFSDRIAEECDSSQYVIYTHYALSICAHCNTDDGEAFVDDVGIETPFSLSGVASRIAYGEMLARTEAAMREMIEEWEAPEGWDGDDDDDDEDEDEDEDEAAA
jgi:hypothetical protein